MSNPLWDCRWPDPVALQVASQRILDGLAPDRTDINLRIVLRVEMEGVGEVIGFSRALLISPWAVERVFWSPFGVAHPPIQSAVPLVADSEGRVASGQGVLLLTTPKPTPVLIAWEPEIGHHFIQTLVSNMEPYGDSLQAFQSVSSPQKQTPPALGNTITKRFEKPVSRRGMFDFLR